MFALLKENIYIMKKLLILTTFIVFTQSIYAQIGHGTNSPHPRAILDLTSSDKGLLLPRLTDAQIFSVTDWQPGSIVYNATHNCLYIRNNMGWMCLFNDGDAWGVDGENTNGVITRTGAVGIGGTVTSGSLLSVHGVADKTGGGTWATTSDERLKTDIKPYSKGLDKLVQIKPVTFKYKTQSGYNDTSYYVGVLAQDIEKVLPSTVSIYDDSEGLSGLSDRRQFDGSELMWTIINSIKELKTENDKLKQILKEQGIIE